MSVFYVYYHIRTDTGAPFYVGKGKADRVTSKKNRNKHWHHIVELAGYTYDYVATGLDEELAFLCERELIDQTRAQTCPGADWVKGRVKREQS